MFSHPLKRLCLLMLWAVLSLTGCEGSLAALIGVPLISAEEVAAQSRQATPPLLLDVRQADEYQAGHVPGSLWADPARLEAWLASGGLPDRPVVTICRSGKRSLGGAAAILVHARQPVHSLQGGMLRWQSLGYPVEVGEGKRIIPANTQLPMEQISVGEQVLLTVNASFLKPLHMLISLLLIVALWRATAIDLRWLRWGVMGFLAGETFCAINFFFGKDESFALELLHDVGMWVVGALVPMALFRLFDERVFRLSAPTSRCQFQRLCGRCWKFDAVQCGLQRTFQFIIPAVAFLTLIPYSLPLRPTDRTVEVFGTAVRCPNPLDLSFAQFRIYPLLAIALFGLAFGLLRRSKDGIDRARLPFFLGLGITLFSSFRFLLVETYRVKPYLAFFWEEATELITVAGVAVFLYFFRHQLELRREARPPVDPAASLEV